MPQVVQPSLGIAFLAGTAGPSADSSQCCGEAAAGAGALLGGGDTAIAQAADAITKAAAEVRLLEAGIRGLRQQRAAALASDLRPQAEMLREHAGEKRKQHADLAACGRKLLDE